MQAFFTTSWMSLLSRALLEKWVDSQVAIKLSQMNPVCTLTHFIPVVLIVSHLHVCLQYNAFCVGYSLKFFVDCFEFLCTYNYDLWLLSKNTWYLVDLLSVFVFHVQNPFQIIIVLSQKIVCVLSVRPWCHYSQLFCFSQALGLFCMLVVALKVLIWVLY